MNPVPSSPKLWPAPPPSPAEASVSPQSLEKPEPKLPDGGIGYSW